MLAHLKIIIPWRGLLIFYLIFFSLKYSEGSYIESTSKIKDIDYGKHEDRLSWFYTNICCKLDEIIFTKYDKDNIPIFTKYNQALWLFSSADECQKFSFWKLSFTSKLLMSVIWTNILNLWFICWYICDIFDKIFVI